VHHTHKNIRLGIFLNVVIGIVFIVAAVIVVITTNYSMRQQALIEAQSKARIILDRNLATHAYFSQIMKPSIFAWSEPFRTKEYFDHTWMSSTYAIREIEKYFKSFNPSGYSFKDAAINARSPENEADVFERAFIEKLNADKKLESESIVRNIDGKPYLVVLRKGEDMEVSCLRCHSHPKDAPKGLTDYYGSKRSFNRKTGDVISAVSLRIPLSEAYAAANSFSLKLSTILLIVLAFLFTVQYWFYRRYLLKPLNVMRDKANEIATQEGHLGEQIPQSFGRELNGLTAAFNEMSIKLRHDRDHLEELVDQRTEALRESEEQYHSLFENMLDGFAYCEMLYDEQDRPVDFVYLDVNKTFEQLTGLKNVVGKKATEAIPGIKELNPELFEIYGRVALTGIPEIFEIDFKPLAKNLSVSVYSPQKEYFVAVFDDMTSRKQAEEALSNSEKKYRNIFENATEGIFQSTPEGRYISVNPAFARIGGYNSPDEMMDTVTDIQKMMYVHKDDRTRLLELLNRQGQVNNFEAEIRRRDNTIIWILMNVKAIRDQGGKIILLEGTIQDITERKRVEEEFQASKAQLSNALEIAQLGHWEYDVANDLFTFNDHFYKIFHTSVEQFGGYTMHSAEYAHHFVHPDDIDVVREEIRKAIETTDPHFSRHMEHRMLYADGTIGYISVRFFIVKDSQGNTVKTYGVNQDITSHKQAEEKIKASLLEKETMLKEIHHRVKNNLQVISSLLGLQSSYVQDEKSRKIFQESQSRVSTMARIHTMLYQSKDMSRVDFGGFISDLVSHLQQSYGFAGSPVEIYVDVSGVSLPIETSIPCGLILNELVSNALKHAFPDTEVREQGSGSRGQEKEQKDEITITLTENSYDSPPSALRPPLITLTVSDNGIGFPEAVDFKNTKSLGLELVNLLVGQMNGTIDLHVKGGTTFIITFPAIGKGG